MTVSKTADISAVKPARPSRKENGDVPEETAALQLGELSELLGYSLKRAQLKVFEDFINFVALLDGLESRDLCARMRSTNDRRSHILVLTDKGRAVLARAKKLVASKHEARLNELLGPANRAALLEMLAKIAREF